jgi:hypothetical protein
MLLPLAEGYFTLNEQGRTVLKEDQRETHQGVVATSNRGR